MHTPDPDRYGTHHRRLRTQLVAAYEADGRGWPCALGCNQPLTDDPTLLDLAHTDSGGHAGLAHRRCNTGDAARLGHDRRNGRHDPQPRPRTRW